MTILIVEIVVTAVTIMSEVSLNCSDHNRNIIYICDSGDSFDGKDSSDRSDSSVAILIIYLF